MILRNGVRSTLRARGRTVLFTLLIWLLTVSLALGLGMWAYCAQALAAIDESYTSIALVEYMGDDYPEPDKADDQARQAAQALDGATMADIDGVTLWETSAQTLAALSGYGGREPFPMRTTVWWWCPTCRPCMRMVFSGSRTLSDFRTQPAA